MSLFAFLPILAFLPMIFTIVAAVLFYLVLNNIKKANKEQNLILKEILAAIKFKETL